MTKFNSQFPVKPPAINTIDIWQIPLDSHLVDNSKLSTTLDTQELERYQHMHKKHQLSFLVSHIACRQILAHYLGIPAKQIKYKKNKHGKPLLDHDSAIHFNMSHSKTLAIIAVSAHSIVGVDLEFTGKKSSWEKIARRFFNPAEIQYLFEQEIADQKKTFFQIWTRKEAYIKALGTGFATPLASFNVINPNIMTDSGSTPDKNIWYQKDLDINPQYTATVVQNTPIDKIRYYSY